jgi:hypothetical protein
MLPGRSSSATRKFSARGVSLSEALNTKRGFSLFFKTATFLKRVLSQADMDKVFAKAGSQKHADYHISMDRTGLVILYSLWHYPW